MRRTLGDYLRRVELKGAGGMGERMLLEAISLYRRARGVVEGHESSTLSRLFLRWKHLERTLVCWRYRFVTFAELVVWTNEWARAFPRRFDMIVGIPRSGLVVAGLVALKLGRPLTTPELLAEHRCWHSGRMAGSEDPRHLLLVDDSISTGGTFEKNLAMVRAAMPQCEVTRGALIVTPGARHLVDLYYVEMPQPRLFEWNMLHVKKGVLAADLDGVICEDCPPGVDADDARYAAWVQSAKPYLIPTFEIDFIVSSRLERYRQETEEWLARQGVRYRELVLWNIESKSEGRGRHAQQKIEKLLRIKPEMFWESSSVQAREIWRATKIPTLCIDEMRLFA